MCRSRAVRSFRPHRRTERRPQSGESAVTQAAGGLTDSDLQERFGFTPQQVVVARPAGGGSFHTPRSRKLFVSGHTARNHTYRVLTKLEASSEPA